MKFPTARIIVFAKAPIAGQCKTRLIPALGDVGAAELHHRLVHRTLQTATQTALSPVELWCADELEHDFYVDCQKRYGLQLKQQVGRDVGERMAHALNKTLEHSDAAILIGCDCPSLRSQELDEALSALYAGSQCVVTPAEDGGYVLVGLNRPCNAIFEGIHWGSDTVMGDTRRQLTNNKIRWHEMAAHHDIDLPIDLIHLPAELRQP